MVCISPTESLDFDEEETLARTCHINGPAEFPIQYAPNIIALVVTRFVCPAVTAESQDNESTGKEISQERLAGQTDLTESGCSNACENRNEIEKFPRNDMARTSEPDREEQANFVAPGKNIDEDRTQNVRNEVEECDPGAAAGPGGDRHARPDRHYFDNAGHAAK